MNVGRRRRRAFVGVRRPHVERHGAHLEDEAHEHEHARRRRASGCAPPAVLRRRADAREVGVTGRAVEEREAVEQERRRERAEQEVLERPLGRPRADARRNAVIAYTPMRHRLEPEEERQRVARRRRASSRRPSRTGGASRTRRDRGCARAGSRPRAAPRARRRGRASMSKKSVKRSTIRATARRRRRRSRRSTPTIQTAPANAAPAKSTTVVPSARPPGTASRLTWRSVENASTSMSSSAPRPTTRSGERASGEWSWPILSALSPARARLAAAWAARGGAAARDGGDVRLDGPRRSTAGRGSSSTRASTSLSTRAAASFIRDEEDVREEADDEDHHRRAARARRARAAFTSGSVLVLLVA